MIETMRMQKLHNGGMQMTKRKEVTFKEVEGMLFNLYLVKAEIRDIEIEIENIKNEYVGIAGAPEGEKASSPTNVCNSNVENEVIIRDEHMERLKALKRKKELAVERVDNMLTTLSKDEKELVQHIYYSKYTVEKTAVLLDMTPPTVRTKKKLVISSLVTFLNSKN